MHRLLILLVFALPVWAQEADQTKSTDSNSAEAPESAEEQADSASDDEEDDDELYAEEDEDKFIPSEDVKFGQSIPFPTDI